MILYPTNRTQMIAFVVSQQEEAFGFYRLCLLPAYRGKYRDFRSPARVALGVAKNLAKSGYKPFIP